MISKFRIFLFFSIFFIIYHLSFIISASALAFPAGFHSVNVSASIGQYYVSFAGFIAPNASVVLTTNNNVLRSTVADQNGYFSISQVLVKEGTTSFCFTAVDVKRLGESDSCITVPPVNKDYTKNNLFLPPTIGLFRTQIQAGGNAIIWGYSMPGAAVTVHSSDGTSYTATAGKDGYYEVDTVIKNAGNYDLSATAVLKGQKSEKPTNKVTLVALTLAQSTSQSVSNWLKNLLTFLFNIPLGPLWLAPAILILIFILVRKLQGKPLIPTGNPLAKEKLYFDYLFRKRKLHHHWIVGY